MSSAALGECAPLVTAVSWGTLSEGLRDGEEASPRPDKEKAGACSVEAGGGWDSRRRLSALGSVALLAILSKVAGNAIIYLYAAGEVKTGAEHAIQAACGISDVDFAILVGYCPGVATVLAGVGLSVFRPLPADTLVLRNSALAGAVASAVGLRGPAKNTSSCVLPPDAFLFLFGALGSPSPRRRASSSSTSRPFGSASASPSSRSRQRRPWARARASLSSSRPRRRPRVPPWQVAFIDAPRDSFVGHAAATGLVLASEPIGAALAVVLQYPALYASWRVAASWRGALDARRILYL